MEKGNIGLDVGTICGYTICVLLLSWFTLHLLYPLAIVAPSISLVLHWQFCASSDVVDSLKHSKHSW